MSWIGNESTYVMQANIDKKSSPEDWRYREAATAAFGAILEGPSVERLSTYVAAGVGFLLNAMKDPNQQVRHTTAWTIGRIHKGFKCLGLWLWKILFCAVHLFTAYSLFCT